MFKIYNLGERFFFCYGCISLGVFNSQILLTYLIIFLMPAVFVLLEVFYCDDSFHLSLVSISLVSLDFLTICLFLMNVFSDAGMVRPEISNQDEPKEKFKVIKYKKETFTVKFCEKCKIFRALRAHHCKFCGVCVEDYDHHSQIISNCVGRRNRKSFVFLLWFAIITIFEILMLSLYNLLSEKSRNDKPRIIYSLVFLALSSFLFFSVGMMLCLQMYLISNGLNTVEYFRGGLNKNKNPFHEGVFKNWFNFLRTRKSHKTIDLKYLKTLEAEKTANDSIEINLQTFNH